MLTVEKTETYGWEAAIRGMRNPMNSWDKSDTKVCDAYQVAEYCEGWCYDRCPYGDNCEKGVWVNDFQSVHLGENDFDLMKRLCKAGTDHRKYLRMITVYCDITAPLYWWKEFDTYKVGTVANSCSTMHKIQSKRFERKDFSIEHLSNTLDAPISGVDMSDHHFIVIMDNLIACLNVARDCYNETKDKKYWWEMVQLLPSSYNQKRTIMLNYEVLSNIYKSRKNHKLDEWHTFCDWIKALPYSELITDERKNFADYVHAEEYK